MRAWCKDASAVSRLDAAAASGGEILRSTLSVSAHAGVTPAEVERAIAERIAAAGATPVTPDVFPACASIAVNAEIAHAVPSTSPLQRGDLVTVDVPVCVGGWWSDQADSVVVGGGTHDLIMAARSVARAMFNRIRPGVLWSAVAESARSEAARLDVRLVAGLAGHGIGRDLHEPPVAWLEGGQDFTLLPGLCVTLEPVVTTGCGEAAVGGDGLTLVTMDGHLAAGAERAVVVTRDGARVLGRDGDFGWEPR